MKTKLNQTQRKYLKALAHNKNPVVSIGNKGLTEAVTGEIKVALDHHELIKIKLPAGEKAMRNEMLERICVSCNAGMVTLIGRIGVIFKAAKDSRITLPK